VDPLLLASYLPVDLLVVVVAVQGLAPQGPTKVLGVPKVGRPNLALRDLHCHLVVVVVEAARPRTSLPARGEVGVPRVDPRVDPQGEEGVPAVASRNLPKHDLVEEGEVVHSCRGVGEEEDPDPCHGDQVDQGDQGEGHLVVDRAGSSLPLRYRVCGCHGLDFDYAPRGVDCFARVVAH